MERFHFELIDNSFARKFFYNHKVKHTFTPQSCDLHTTTCRAEQKTLMWRRLGTTNFLLTFFGVCLIMIRHEQKEKLRKTFL